MLFALRRPKLLPPFSRSRRAIGSIILVACSHSDAMWRQSGRREPTSGVKRCRDLDLDPSTLGHLRVAPTGRHLLGLDSYHGALAPRPNSIRALDGPINVIPC